MLDRFFDSYQSGLSGPALQNPRLREEILQGVQARVSGSSRKEKRHFIRLWIPLAAVISLFALAYFFIDMTSLSSSGDVASAIVEASTQRGQKLQTTLPDGTKVHLNGDSKISYTNNFGEDMREVTVAGEVYFEVVKDARTFVVHADRTRTQVLGTAFNVRNRSGGNIEVTLVSGKVKVIAGSGQSADLAPNQQAVMKPESGDILTREVDIVPYTCWKDNILFFERTSLKEAIEALESWYAVKIDIANPALERCLITAKYRDEPLGNVLSSFQFLLNLQITRISEGHYSINGTGCK